VSRWPLVSGFTLVNSVDYGLVSDPESALLPPLPGIMNTWINLYKLPWSPLPKTSQSTEELVSSFSHPDQLGQLKYLSGVYSFGSKMPPPRPLSNIASARAYRPDSQALTPRTPHSRAGRAEEGYTDVEFSQVPHNTDANDDEYQEVTHHQTAPLLRSSRSATFPNRHEDEGDYEPKRSAASSMREAREDSGWSLYTLWTYFPLVLGSFLAFILLFLAFVAYERPDEIKAYLGISVNNAIHTHYAPPDHIISYENYTRFPLLAEEYRAECYKIHSGLMSHGGYWEPHGMDTMDVLHQDEMDGYAPRRGEQPVCTSTITYMLDGKVGLFADLALLAQVAALAREVALAPVCGLQTLTILISTAE
jgi:hypothetical protein